MKRFFSIILAGSCISITLSCQSGEPTKTTKPSPTAPKNDLPKVPKFQPSDSLSFLEKSVLEASGGTKSVVFSKNMQFLYAMNLEGMSVYEFDRKQRKITRIFQFKATPGKGWDYDEGKEIDSYEEKPVEAFLSHHDSILWVSLHNAGGIVPIRLFEPQDKPLGKTDKLIYVQNALGKTQDTLYSPIILTGKTPKVISCTSDDRYLMVSNWHSYNVSVLEINNRTYPFGQVIKNTAVSSIPRGIVMDEAAQKTYVAIMGGSSLAVLDNTTWEKTADIKVASNPRHILQDQQGRLLVSFNSLGQIGCIDPKTGNTLFKASTEAQPRTMALSKSGEYLFVTCYSGNRLMVYKVLEDRFQLMHSLDCPGKPVGVDVYEDQGSVEAWVCSYSSGSISVFKFVKINN